MADSIEAASHSLKEYRDETLKELINKIVSGQIADGRLNNAPITFKDIEVAKEVFLTKLKMAYHTRISYPELKTQDDSARKVTADQHHNAN